MINENTYSKPDKNILHIDSKVNSNQKNLKTYKIKEFAKRIVMFNVVVCKREKILKPVSVLFIGDIVGEPGLNEVETRVPSLIEEYKAEFVVMNGENADKGKGIIESQANRLFDAGAHIITTGNHIWENWKSRPLLSANPNIIRPYNYPSGNAGRGFSFFAVDENITFAVLQLQGRLFIQTIDCPFHIADNALNYIQQKTKNIIVDFHADATAEKMTMGWHLDGRVSAVLGTHTHIQTSDAQILPKGTAYISDVGMSGPYDSVLGMRKDVALKRFTLQTAHKYELAKDDVRICGANVIIDTDTGKALEISSFMSPMPRRNTAAE